MIIAHPQHVPLKEVLPRLVELAPAEEDWEVNGPLFKCFIALYQKNEPTILPLTAQVIAAATKVLNEPEDHLDDETRRQVKELGEYLHTKASGQ